MMQQADIALAIGARSEKGRREDNQDKMTAFSTPLGTFYIVADGMGGHRGGAEASLSVVEGYRKHLQAFPEAADFADVLQHATTLTNAEILAAGRSGDPSIAGMGSTVVMAMLRTEPGAGPGGMEVLTAHIGDSRAYLLRGGKLTQLTHDHSAVQRMVDEGLISAEAAKTHPDLNVLTRAIGKQADIVIEVGQRIPLYPGDTLLLCTDGLWGHVPDEQIAYELSVDRSASETADTLVQLALDRGSDDNITLQILRLEDRNAAGRPYSPPIAPLIISPVTQQEMQRAPVATVGVPAVPTQVAPAAMAAAPVMRTEGFAPQRRKSRSWVYALLLVAGGALVWGGYYCLRQFSGLWPKHSIKSAQPCPNGTGKVSDGCPANPDGKGSPNPGTAGSDQNKDKDQRAKDERERKAKEEKDRKAKEDKDRKAKEDKDRQIQQDQLNKKNHGDARDGGTPARPPVPTPSPDLTHQQHEAAQDKPQDPPASDPQHR